MKRWACFDEVLRVISLQLNAKHRVTDAGNWKQARAMS